MCVFNTRERTKANVVCSSPKSVFFVPQHALCFPHSSGFYLVGGFFFVFIAFAPLDKRSVRMGVAESSLQRLYIMHRMTLQRLCEHSLARKRTICPLKDY